MKVQQDDMNLESTDNVWNVRYDARVGNNDADWRNYDPYQTKKLQDVLDLSELEEMDFSILVTKFPSPNYDYYGEMTLSATQANFRNCPPSCGQECPSS